ESCQTNLDELAEVVKKEGRPPVSPLPSEAAPIESAGQ
ncbi:MAG: hypothetical protein RLZZ09_2205, partial [Pseudomonadota bacterium]